jgi:hypothetical protein
MDGGLVRNMQITLSNKSEKLCISSAFIIRIKFLVSCRKLGEWRDVEWIMVGASNVELVRMISVRVPIIYLLITGEIYLGSDKTSYCGDDIY